MEQVGCIVVIVLGFRLAWMNMADRRPATPKEFVLIHLSMLAILASGVWLAHLTLIN